MKKPKFMFFHMDEFACKCECGSNDMDIDFIKKLDMARFVADTPFIITSGYRCDIHNRKVGGIENSSHKEGLAVDILVKNNKQAYQVLSGLFNVGFKRIIYYANKSFIHVDMDLSKPNPLFLVQKGR